MTGFLTEYLHSFIRFWNFKALVRNFIIFLMLLTINSFCRLQITSVVGKFCTNCFQ